MFRGKTIFCPCDDPEWSNFTKFFAQNFEQARIDIQSIQPTEFQDGDVEFDYFQDEPRSRRYQYSFEARLFPNSSLAPTNHWRRYAIQEIPMK